MLETAGALASGYLRLVHRTNRFVQEPPGFIDAIAPELPAIVAMWHGQHFMVHYAWPPRAKVAALISRHEDGEINAIILRHLGVEPIRGSGGKGATKTRMHGGAAALRAMARRLADGRTVVMTADVPKVSRRAGLGIVTLARMTGRPIYPIAVVTSRRFDFRSWDRASLGKPFGRGAMVLGRAVRVERDADEAALEAARVAVEAELDRVHRRAYGLIGTRDPGGGGAGGTEIRDAPDHDVVSSNRADDMNVIEFQTLEHDVTRHPVPTFRHHALAPDAP